MAAYTVKAGDSLSKIARDVLGNLALWPAIASLNSIAAPYIIRAGQVLQLPGGSPGVPGPVVVPVVQRPPLAPGVPGSSMVPGAEYQPGASGLIDFAKKNWVWLALAGVGVGLLLWPAGAPSGKTRR